MIPPLLYGTLREHYLLLFGAAGVVATVAGSAAAWFGAQIGARRASHQVEPSVPASLDAHIARRLDTLQQSLDAVAIEVERMTEAQRFSAQLLADGRPRGADPLPRPRPDGRVPTPH